MERIYDNVIRQHLLENRQIAMITGPRQAGKTTSARQGAGDHLYRSWDNQPDRLAITRGPDAFAQSLNLDLLSPSPRHVVLDEVHKYRSWRDFLKGFFDVYADRTRLVVTGSARLGFFRRGGDSLMGRYFLYRLHPLSVAELLATSPIKQPLRPPARLDRTSFDLLLRLGGYPEPFLKGSDQFYRRWRRLRSELLFRGDLRDLTRIQEAGQVETLGLLLAARAGQTINLSNLARDVNVAVDTVRRWLAALEALFYCFTLRPWARNIPKTLRKQPKVYLWDWSLVADPGARLENLTASHLLKAVHFWTDLGLGTFDLYYLRDKLQREVDFLVTRDSNPWFLVETKASGNRPPTPSLELFQRLTGAAHALQVAFDLDYVDADCFSPRTPTVVPAPTFLSQLV